MTLGIGATLGILVGDEETRQAINQAYQLPIRGIRCTEDKLTVQFAEGKLTIRDDAQWCCERRWLACDDDLSAFIGATIIGVEVRDGGTTPWIGGEHAVAFLIVTTTGGSFTVATHNEHNGYYGGFDIVARFTREAQP